MLFTSVFRIRIVLNTYGSAFADPYRIRILRLIFSLVAVKMRTKNKFFFKFSLLSVGTFTSSSGSGAVHINADPDPEHCFSCTCTSRSGFIFDSSCLWMLCLVLKQTGHHQNIRNRRALQFQCGKWIFVNINYLVIISVADPDPHGSAFILVSWIRIQEC